MIVNELVSGIFAIVIAYLLGSLPTAYVTTRLFTGKDIRQLGSGNAGANNVYREVGLPAAAIVAIVDIGKGTAAVAIAHALVDTPYFQPNLFVVLASFAVVIGHIWPIYLRFTGGNGIATTIGTLFILLPREVGIVFVLIVLLLVVTHNPVLSTHIGLLSMPVSTWLFEKDWLYFGYCIVLIVVIILHFLPTAKAAVARAGTRANLLAELLHRDKG